MISRCDASLSENNGRPTTAIPALCVRMVFNFVMNNGRPTCPLEDFRMAPDKSKINWEEILASMTSSTIHWFPRREEVPNVLC